MYISEHSKKVSIQVSDDSTWDMPGFHFVDLEQLDKFITDLQRVREDITA